MTRRRLLFNLVLVIAVVALGSTLWFMRRPPQVPPAPVSRFAVDNITRMEVHHENDVIVLARNAGQAWRLNQPVHTRADAKHVAVLLQLAGAVPQRRYERGAIDEPVTGLDEPALTVRFNDGAPIAVGAEGPSPGSRYVRTAHALLLVRLPDLTGQSLAWPHWIARSLLDANARLTRITLPRLTLTRSETGAWQISPAAADRGAGPARATIEAWRHARVLAVEPEQPNRERTARVTLRFADKPARHLDVIARSPWLVLRDPALGLDYHLAANLAPPLLDMTHPDLNGADKGNSTPSSAIPLTPTPGDSARNQADARTP